MDPIPGRGGRAPAWTRRLRTWLLTGALTIAANHAAPAQKKLYDLPPDPRTASATACTALSEQYERIRVRLHKDHEACVKRQRRAPVVEAPRCERSRAASAAYGCETRAACVTRSNALFQAAEEQLAAEDRCSARMGLGTGGPAPPNADFTDIPAPIAVAAIESDRAASTDVVAGADLLAFIQTSGHGAFAAVLSVPVCVTSAIHSPTVGGEVCAAADSSLTAPSLVGLLVVSMAADAAAAGAGLSAGDIIYSAAGIPVTSPSDLDRVANTSAGGTVSLGISRSGRTYLVRVPIPPSEPVVE